MHAPVWAWFAVVAFIAAMLAVDLLVLHRKPHEVTVKEAAVTSAGWVAISGAFGMLIWLVGGASAAGEYTAGYLIEKSLSIDNVFVFALLLGWFAVPAALQHRVLFWGVVGALVLRFVFVLLGASLLETFHWAIYVFGAFLVFTGVKMALHRNTEMRPDRNPAVRMLRRIMPVSSTYDGGRFVTRQSDERGRMVRAATPLLAVLVAVETTDIVFAVDSIPAVFAVTDDPFIVFTSNAFAVLGMMALYFLLAGLMTRFRHLKTGLATVLVFVGAKMLAADLVHVPVWASLIVISAILAAAIGVSWRRTGGPSAAVPGPAGIPVSTPVSASRQD